ncbi:MAG: trypsin-like peptidase domain-containing protein [Bdellovibrionales bacterium]|nr:trypsin-like peptidase domain-containing protein [Bdellovibrionales bacterium]
MKFTIPLLIVIFLSACGKTQVEKEALPSQNRGLSCKMEGSYKPKAIYGQDNRLDWFEAPGQTTSYWARATLALMPSQSLKLEGDEFRVVADSYGNLMNLCPGQKFNSQPSASFCSGFLVADDLVVTAGHCVRSQSECEQTLFVFDYNKQDEAQENYSVPQSSVYRCSQLVTREVGANDFAIVQLQKPVLDRTPLNLRRDGNLRVGEEVMLIGHPMGLPSKIAEGGRVLKVGDKIHASVDAFAANSGSVILNMATGLVEGILVAGEADFQVENGCRREAVCDGACEGEVITPISKLLDHLPNNKYEIPISCNP